MKGLLELVAISLFVAMVLTWAAILTNSTHHHTVSFEQRWAPVQRLPAAVAVKKKPQAFFCQKFHCNIV